MTGSRKLKTGRRKIKERTGRKTEIRGTEKAAQGAGERTQKKTRGRETEARGGEERSGQT